MINLETAKNNKLEIGYYNAPISSLSGFHYGKETCKCCNTEQNFFVQNPNSNPNPNIVCINCLNNIKIEVSHNTQLGFVDLDLPEFLKEKDAKKNVKEEYYLEMLKTPFYKNFQGEIWMCHCKDFMNYIGTWEAPDFTRESNDGNGKNLFLTMTPADYNHLWDEFELADDEKEFSWDDCLYHVFECRHCKIKQGTWEM